MVDYTAKNLLKACEEELKRKELEYGNMGEDYVTMAAFEERKPTEVCFSLMMKHVTVLKKIAKNPKDFPLAITRHRAMDLINFVVVLLNEIEKAVGENEITLLQRVEEKDMKELL